MDILEKEAFLSYQKQIFLKIGLEQNECVATKIYSCLMASYLKRFSLSIQKQLSSIAWRAFSKDSDNCIDLALSINKENRKCLEDLMLHECCENI